jgi:hypothetical protein
VVDSVHVISAHAQIVSGYDERRGTLFIRDPGSPSSVEALAVRFFETFRAHGPRGFLLAAPERAREIDSLSLPDAQLYDLLDALHGALDRHDRPAAAQASRTLSETAPQHRLCVLADRALAA